MLQKVTHTSLACPGSITPFEGSTLNNDAAMPRLTRKANAMSYLPLLRKEFVSIFQAKD